MVFLIIVVFINAKELRDFKEEIRKQEDEACWLWILDKDGDGISGRTFYDCGVKNIGFKSTCESEWHDLDCKWQDDGVAKGCYCVG